MSENSASYTSSALTEEIRLLREINAQFVEAAIYMCEVLDAGIPTLAILEAEKKHKGGEGRSALFELRSAIQKAESLR